MIKPRVIAFYLPQFHPIPENDKWWGKGFTEWTNVGKAKPLFPGHKQPKVPTELGYYDLRLKDNLIAQVELAKEAGVEGFCWWHYYFGNGKQLLEKPLQMFLEDQTIDFPFCLGWANESWKKKLWNKDAVGDETLIEQKYCGEEDYKRYFGIVEKAFRDSRYIKVDGKPLFLVYKPSQFQDVGEFINCWNNLAHKHLGTEIHFVAHAAIQDKDYEDFRKYFDAGFDAVYSHRIFDGTRRRGRGLFRFLRSAVHAMLGYPNIVNFADVAKHAVNELDRDLSIYPGIICGWDHTPRSGRKGVVFTHFTIAKFKEHILDIFDEVRDKTPDRQIVFLKSWNEWGEGNFMEPDLEFGRAKIEALKECIAKSNTR